MASLLNDALHPGGWTDRRTYRMAVGAVFLLALLLSVILVSRVLPDGSAVILLLLVNLPAVAALLLLTIRRLRDAGWSVWWAALLVLVWRPWPPVYTIDMSFGDVSLHWPVLELVPILIGLLAPSRPPESRIA
jgi:uncharacterized membrane protein YhaH (DUF805 family)